MATIEPPLIRRSAKLRVEDLRVSRLNVRLEADPEGLEKLAESIKTVGLQHPIIVRAVAGEPDAFEVVEGSRRLRALKKLGYSQIECRIAEMDDEQALVASTHENMWRGDITAAELSRAINMMMAMMPEHWTDKKKRGKVAENLGWTYVTAKGTQRPNLTRVKEAIELGEFQERIPGVVVKQRTLGDSNKPTIAWSTARQVQKIVESNEVSSVLNDKPAEERTEFVQQIAKIYQEIPTKERADFALRLRNEPTKPLEEIRRDMDYQEVHSVPVSFKPDVTLLAAIDAHASNRSVSRSTAIVELIQAGLVSIESGSV